MFYSADNAKLLIDGKEILASTAQISLGANLSPNYSITQRHTNDYTAEGGVGGQLSFTYYLTGADYFKTFITGQGETGIERPTEDIYTNPISGNFGGLNFESGYLTSYSVNFSPNSPASANATVNFFDYARGSFTSNSTAPPENTQMLNFSQASVVGEFSSGTVDSFVAGTYNYASEVFPVYLMGETRPSTVSFGPKTVNMNFEIDNPTGYLPFSGARSKITVNLKNSAGLEVDTFECSGVMNSRNLATAVGDYIKQTINITQSSVVNEVTTEGFIGAGASSALNPGQKFTKKGKNLLFVKSVSFRDVVTRQLTYLGSTGIEGTVPEGAQTQEVNLEGPDSHVLAGSPNIVLTSADQVKVGPLNQQTSVSGEAGKEISITGENFYAIDTVNFGTAPASPSAQFSLINDKEIRAVVPANAEWDAVTVFSSTRTGANGNISFASGKSTNEFVVFPQVEKLETPQLVSGAVAQISGRSFGAVTGITFNDRHLTSVSVTDNKIVSGIVPSGDTWGSIKLGLRSGIMHEVDSTFQFKSLAKISSIGPALGMGTVYPSAQTVGGVAAYCETGSMAAISGVNFTTGILYSAEDASVGEEGYVVSFGEDSEVTGVFNIVNTGLMTGIIPTNTPTGTSSVSIYSHHYPEAYPSSVDFTLKYSAPNIVSVSPASGAANVPSLNVITIEGENLYSITGVDFTGVAGAVGIGTMAQGTSIQGSVEGESITVKLPSSMEAITDSAFFDVTVSGRYGDDVYKSGFFHYGIPKISTVGGYVIPTGFISPGQTGLVVGKNFYPGRETRISLVKDSISNTVAEIQGSGFVDDGIPTNYASNFTQFKFTYPEGLQTGLYKARVANVRSAGAGILYNKLLGPYTMPVLSGFSPSLISDTSTNVTISGAFAAVTGVLVGDVIIGDFTAHEKPTMPTTNIPDVTGITFKVTEGLSSAPIHIRTSGGSTSSTQYLQLDPPAPTISGFWIGGESSKPATIDFADQVFGQSDLMTISGNRLDLVTGVQFSGETDRFSVGDSTFAVQDYNTIVLELPLNLNTGSGIFNTIDYQSRSTPCNSEISNSGINIFNFSGISDHKAVAGEVLALSGVNISGTSVLFSGDGGERTISAPTYNPVMQEGLQKVSVQFPTGVSVRSNFMITGRVNPSLYRSDEGVLPIATISGFSGYGAGTISTGAKNLIITGSNYYDGSTQTPVSGKYIVGISGTGYNGIQYKDTNRTGICVNYFPTTGFDTGVGANSSTICEIGVEVTNPDMTRDGFSNLAFIGTGQLFIVDAWYAAPDSPVLGRPVDLPYSASETANVFSADMVGRSETYNLVRRKISAYPNQLIVQGTPAKITGYGPTLGPTGTLISLSGEGLSLATGVAFYSLPNMAEMSYSAAMDRVAKKVGQGIPVVGQRNLASPSTIQRISDNKITVEVPRLAISHATETDIWVLGGTCCTGGKFTIIPENIARTNMAIKENDPTPQAKAGSITNFTQIETINGIQYMVDYKKFPDGSVERMSSTPLVGPAP